MKRRRWVGTYLEWGESAQQVYKTHIACSEAKVVLVNQGVLLGHFSLSVEIYVGFDVAGFSVCVCVCV